MDEPIRAPQHWFDVAPRFIPAQFDPSPCDPRWGGCGTIDVYLKPEKFLALTSTTETSLAITPALVREYAEAMQRGDKFPIPMLKLSREGREWQITGHEGRHRSISASRIGLKVIPVTLDIEGPPERVEEAVDKLRRGVELFVRSQEYTARERGQLMWLTPMAPDGQELHRYIGAAEEVRRRKAALPPVERLPRAADKIRIEIEPLPRDFSFRVAAYDDARPRRKKPVGKLQVLAGDGNIPPTRCFDEIRRLIEKHPEVAQLTWMTVTGTQLDEEYHNRGIGVRMYLAAAREAGRLGAFIVAHQCENERWEDESFTSPMAERVWKSERFTREVIADGLVAWAPPRVERLSVGPLAAGVILVDFLLPDPVPFTPGPITIAALGASAVEKLPTIADLNETVDAIPVDRRRVFDALADDWEEWLPSVMGIDGIETEAIKRWARRNRVQYLNAGSGRAVFGVPEGALKLDFDPRDPSDNLREIRVWQTAPESVRPHLVPILAFEEGFAGRSLGRWLLMERVQPGGTMTFDLKDALRRCGLEDMHSSNVSKDGRALDYAFITDWDAWRACQNDKVERLPRLDDVKLMEARAAEAAFDAARSAEDAWYAESWRMFVAATGGDVSTEEFVRDIEKHLTRPLDLREPGTMARDTQLKAASRWRVESDDGAWDRLRALRVALDEARVAMKATREAAGLDPSTGESMREKRARQRKENSRVELPGEGYYPDLIADKPRGCAYEPDAISDDGTIVHTRCDTGGRRKLHHFRYFVDGDAVAGLTVYAGPRGGGAVIDRVYTEAAHRRQGYARALLDHARDVLGTVKHSKDLTGMGKVWKRGVER